MVRRRPESLPGRAKPDRRGWVVSTSARSGVRSTSGPVPLSYSSDGEMRKSCWGESPTRGVGARNRVFGTHTVRATDAARRWRSKEERLRRVRRTTSEAKLAGARLPREASPAKVAKDGQCNDDHDDDPKPGRHVILSLGACRLYDEPTRIRNVCGPTLRWERLALGRARTQAARGWRRCTPALG
jgi:hypothetical protein